MPHGTRLHRPLPDSLAEPEQGQFVEAWEALVEARERGLVKHIGVSNFLPGHIDLLFAIRA